MNKIEKHIVTATCLLFLSVPHIQAQKNPTWDDTNKSQWGNPFEKVDIPSTADGTMQKAFIYKSKSGVPQPLIISLHTWSGDYTQKDPLAKEALSRDWNYIHPDFRGANKRPEAMGSPLVIADVEDAIRFALEYTGANPKEVHVVGVSGGGYATLLSYMNTIYPVKSFSAWVPISDIESWYWESVGRKQKYAADMINSTSSNGTFDPKEAVLRSPLKQTFPKDRRKDADLFIYAGVHDGYTGSVPITHSIHMYNRLVGELKYGISDMESIARKAFSDPDLVSQSTMIDIVTKRTNPHHIEEEMLCDRNIYLSRKFANIKLIIFEGRHEQLPCALDLIPTN